MCAILSGDGDVGLDVQAWQPVTTASGELCALNQETGEYRYGREGLVLLGQVRPAEPVFWAEKPDARLTLTNRG